MMSDLQLTKKNMTLAMSALFLVFSGILCDCAYYNPFLKDYVGQPEFVVLIPSYNNEAYCYPNLNSIIQQTFDIPFRIIYINDCSTDRTGQLVDVYIRAHKFESLCAVIHNEKRLGSLANIFNVVHTLPDHTIVVLIDGDDFLAHDKVLGRVLQEYTNKNIWMTYGQMVFCPEGGTLCEKIPQSVLDENSFRSHRWVTSHLKTFYAGLFKQIKKEDLLHEGNFFRFAGDFAYMFPMLEMASRGHIAFIPDVLYLYNHHNPISVHNEHLDLQRRLGSVVRQKPKYDPIESPR